MTPTTGGRANVSVVLLYPDEYWRLQPEIECYGLTVIIKGHLQVISDEKAQKAQTPQTQDQEAQEGRKPPRGCV